VTPGSTRPIDALKVLALAAPLLGAAALPGTADAQASFACRLAATDNCHFAVLHRDGRRTDFVLRHGESQVVDDAQPEADRYMVAADFVPPTDPATCSRAPIVGSKPPHSHWCKLSAVGTGRND
jgi:hypothetical protein